MMLDFAAARDIIMLFLAITAGMSAVYLARNKALLENYRATVESQEKRIASLEHDVASQREQIAELRGVNEGYQLAAELYMEAVAKAGICGIAWKCEDREIPMPERVGM